MGRLFRIFPCRIKLAHFETFWDSMAHPTCAIITIAK
nr:MAG TPA: hypothetical protein [Caudoviricetes sp.]DAZ02699.1 MAG TPA: hypothetical protein [Caudoviricetes sp.]